MGDEDCQGDDFLLNYSSFTKSGTSMKSIKYIIYIFFMMIINSCQSDLEKVKGHWHNAHSNSDWYWTIDINDSTTIFNLHSIDRKDSLSFQHAFHKGDLLLPMYCSGPHNFKIINDTLYIGGFDSNKGDPFIKIENDWDDQKKDFFGNLLVKTEPNINNQSTPIQKISSKSLIHYGKQKAEFNELGKADSFTLSVNDVLIKLIDIKLFLELKLEANPNNNFILNIDKEVPRKKIDELVNFILTEDSTINLYRTYINEDKRCVGVLPIEGGKVKE